VKSETGNPKKRIRTLTDLLSPAKQKQIVNNEKSEEEDENTFQTTTDGTDLMQLQKKWGKRKSK